ncbi:MAG TPA: pseudouridine synthase [Veillonellaceae bacterium]|nr:pseudouridine synthase [Veillonellaceae bacterium]
MTERLQKILSRCGICSRRKAEELILQGRVKVNGSAERTLGSTADLERDRIEVDGRPLRRERKRYFLFYKPDRVITSSDDPQGRRTVMDFFGSVRERIFPVGRLDYHTEGLLLMTNDGKLDEWLTHPRGEVKKVYEVEVRGRLSERLAAQIGRGVRLEDGKTAPCGVEVLAYDEARNRTFLRMTLHEGKNREIRRIMAHFHYPVFSLKRTQYSFLTADRLKKGTFRALTSEEVKKLYANPQE